MNKIDSHIKNNPEWFNQIEVLSESDINNFEINNGIELPESYKLFILNYGCGYFGSINISSVKESSDFSISKRPKIYYDNMMFIITTDDGSGGYYGFFYKDKYCDNNVYYYYPNEENPPEIVSHDFNQFVLDHAFIHFD